MDNIDSIEFGIDTFGDVPRDDRGELMSYAAAIRAVVEEAVIANHLVETVDLDVENAMIEMIVADVAKN